MNIIACIKQVPASDAAIKIAADEKTIDLSEMEKQSPEFLIVNPYDEFAVEEAVRTKEKFGGEVTVITMGSDKAVKALRTCLAMGADKAVLLKDPAFDGADSYTTALVLSEAIKKLQYDVIFFGKQAIDDDLAAVGIYVAELLGLPHVGLINKLEIDAANKKAVAQRPIEGGIEKIETTLPAVFTCQKGLNEPRYASLPGIMKAKSKPLQEMNLSALGLKAEDAGKNGAKIKIERVTFPPKRSGGKKIEGEPAQAVKELVRLLKEEAKVL